MKGNTLNSIIRHIKRVEDNCNIIAQKLWETNYPFALEMVRRGRIHDASKLEDFEFKYLWKNSLKFEEALKHHHSLNSHHPEYYQNGIYGMNEADLAEMVCDVLARSQEFGSDIKEWLFIEAPKRYGFEGDLELIGKLKYYLDLLLTPKFEK